MVIDFGLMVQVAIRLAQDGHEVLYYDPAAPNEFPSSVDTAVGKGFDGVECLRNEFWREAGACDGFIFTDVNTMDLQRAVRERIAQDWPDKIIYGLGDAELLELDRWGTYKLLQEMDVPVPETRRVIGIDALRKACELDTGFWIKTGYFRGDFETLRHEDMRITELELLDLEKRLADPDKYPFLLVEHIDGIEIAYDFFQVDGRFPRTVAWGLEKKGDCYFGKVSGYDELPKQIRDLNTAIAPIFEEDKARGFFSFEQIVGKDRKGRATDACMRPGHPPEESQLAVLDNFSDIVLGCAAGEVVEPEFNAPYFGQLHVHSERAARDKVCVVYPDQIARDVKLRNLMRKDGTDYVLNKRAGVTGIGALTAIGDSIDEVQDKLVELAGQVKGNRLSIEPDSLDELREKIEEAKGYGVEF